VISLFASGLVYTGIIILAGSLVVVQRLIVRLQSGPMRSRWYFMVALIALFISGYLAYAIVFRESHSFLVDLIVPFVFLFGACFVLLVATLSLQTAMDMTRITLLERDAVTDPLTGVFNRRYMDRRINEEAASARRYGLPLSILLLDIDYFKQINDRYGHQVGDRVLAAMAKIIDSELRESDIFTRYGGEEFLIIAPHTPLLSAIEVAERVRKCIESHDFCLSDEPGGTGSFRVTVSIGVASLDDGAKDSETLIRAADKNLLRAKQTGRNRVIAGRSGATRLTSS